MTNMAHATVAEMLAAWDRGETIWSISMGGLGPSYEQCIQTMAVEFTRAAIAEQFTPQTAANEEQQEADYEKLRKLCSKALKKFDNALGGVTGAMFGAAVWLAWRWINGGPRKLIDDCFKNDKPERAIQVNNLMKLKVT